MRKGTKSCLECRRRKIKCTFEPGRTAICNECFTRGSTCIDQEHGDIQSYTQQTAEQTSSSLRERVGQLESLVKQVLNRIPDGGAGAAAGDASLSRSQVDAQAAEVLKSLKSSPAGTLAGLNETEVLPGGIRDDAPALTLFNNEVISRKDSQPSVTRAQYNKSKALIAALTKLLPSPHDLDIILSSSHEWWVIWRKMFPDIADRRCETMKESVSHALRSDKPAEIAKIMLCIAISLHQLPENFDWSKLHLKESRPEFIEKFITSVDKLIIQDDEIAATVEGIECMTLAAKMAVNMGRPRRAWLLFHRAIAFSQLLGFHRLAAQPDKSSLEYRRQVNIWIHLILGDRFLALLLGLPYSIPENFSSPYLSAGASPDFPANAGETFILKMVGIVAKLVDRNQSVIPMAYSGTMRLDQELEELFNAQDPQWWDTGLIPGQATEDHFDRLQAAFFFHQTKVLLHMPFMLRSPSTDKRYKYSHASALEGARGMIKYYDALRTNTSVGPYICKLIDFQAFTAGMLLLLNLCGYSAQHRGNNAQLADLEQDQRDSDIIDNTIALLHEAAKEVGGVVAAQSAQALEMLSKVRQGSDACPESCEVDAKTATCQVAIPYFGTITIGMGKQFVPIKSGTYPKPGEPRRYDTTVVAGGVPITGLPTPPSMTSGSSAQPSPMSNSIDNTFPRQRLPAYESTNYIAPGLESWPEDDPFVTFDSFMALPPGSIGGMDMPSAGSSSGSTGFTPNYSATPEQLGDGGMGIGAPGGYPFSGFPFGGQSTSNVDLDQGWNWFGVDAPLIQ
jgi:hypothetical protein